MSTWDSYPSDYRAKECAAIRQTVEAGECAALIGLSGSGKSNLMGFLAHRALSGLQAALVDCNRLDEQTMPGLMRLLQRSLRLPPTGEPEDLEDGISVRLQAPPGRLTLLLDRFDALPPALLPGASGYLRFLRDEHKYALALVIAARRPPDAALELAELFFAYTLWLGPLSIGDATWSARQYTTRRGLDWGDETVHKLIEVSGGYPSFLRACCDAYTAGAGLALEALRSHPAVRHRLEEFQADQPSPEMIRLSGLESNPLLPQGGLLPAALDTGALTAKEMRLLSYLQAHAGEVCAKDDLIRAAWPEDRVFINGIRDDSLAQLVRRLREKIEPDPAHPKALITVPGRGYKYLRRTSDGMVLLPPG